MALKSAILMDSCRGLLRCLFRTEAAAEFIHLAGRIDNFLLARIERMAA